MINLYLRSQVGERSRKEVRLGVGENPLLSFVLVLSTRSRVLTRDWKTRTCRDIPAQQLHHCAAKTIDGLVDVWSV